MPDRYPYSCLETCGQEKPCGNRYCSANPKYIPPTPKKRGKSKKSDGNYVSKPH